MVARSIGLFILRLNQQNKAFDVLREKIYLGDETKEELLVSTPIKAKGPEWYPRQKCRKVSIHLSFHFKPHFILTNLTNLKKRLI